ncbi:MAG: cyanophycinase, partial [Chitinophagaceae bacterium]
FTRLIGKKNCSIEIITTASSEAKETFSDYHKVFSKLCSGNIGHIHHDTRGEMLADDLSARIAAADGIFITGGDQLKLTSIYGGSKLLCQLKQRYIHEQIVIAGTSAGAMAMSTPMIFSGSKENQQITGEVRVTIGLEFLKDICIDTHFVDRGRFVRMAQVIATNPGSVGVGIEEDTAIVLRRGTDMEVIGSGIVIVTEGFAISRSNILEYGTGGRISIENLSVKLLASGNTYVIPQLSPPHF